MDGSSKHRGGLLNIGVLCDPMRDGTNDSVVRSDTERGTVRQPDGLALGNERRPMSEGVSARLVGLRVAANYLAVSVWTVRDYVQQGLIPLVELPALRPREGERHRGTLRRVLVDLRDLDVFIESRKRKAG